MKLKTMIRRFLREDYGAVAIEFGLTISTLIVILTGCYETARYILLNQKLDRTASSVADLLARQMVAEAELANFAALWRGKSDVDETDGLFGGAAGRAGDAGDGDGEVGVADASGCSRIARTIALKSPRTPWPLFSNTAAISRI